MMKKSIVSLGYAKKNRQNLMIISTPKAVSLQLQHIVIGIELFFYAENNEPQPTNQVVRNIGDDA
jgi:hypothetical protein